MKAKAQPQKPAQPPKPAAAPKPLTAGQLNSCNTTVVAIQASAAALSLFLPTSHKKADIINAYTVAVANSSTPGALKVPQPPMLQPSQTKAQSGPKNWPTLTTTWSVRRKSGFASLPFLKPLNGDVPALVQYFQDTITTANPHTALPLSLLGGHWSNNVTNNFVLIFSGKPPMDLVCKYHKVILQPFDDTFNLVPSKGFTRMIILRALVIHKPDSSLPSKADVLNELWTNVPFQGAQIIDGPTWFQATTLNPTAKVGVLSFILIDTDNTWADAMTGASARSRVGIWLYRKCVSVKQALPSYPFKQCSQCFALSHPTERCNRPITAARCGKCGDTRHPTSEHQTKCTRRHTGPACDCPP